MSSRKSISLLSLPLVALLSSPEAGLSPEAGYCWSSPSTSTPPKLSLLNLWISVLSPSRIWASWRSCERISSCTTTMKEPIKHVWSYDIYSSKDTRLHVRLDKYCQFHAYFLHINTIPTTTEIWGTFLNMTANNNCCKLQRKPTESVTKHFYPTSSDRSQVIAPSICALRSSSLAW